MDTTLVSLERRLYEGKKIIPRPEFRESLKAFLFSQIGEKNETWFLQYLPAEDRIIFPETKKHIWQNLQETWQEEKSTFSMERVGQFLRRPLLWGILFLLVCGASGMYLFQQFLLGSTVQSTSSSTLSALSGEVAIASVNKQSGAYVGRTLVSGDAISTKNGQAEITFFDGSFLVMGENSLLRIEKHIPAPAFPDTGKIDLLLEKGRILARTFTDPTADSEFIIRSGDVQVAPYSGVIDLTVQEKGTLLRVWRHSAQITDLSAKENHIFIADTKVQFVPATAFVSGPLTDQDKKDPWLVQAFAVDARHLQQNYQQFVQTTRKETGVLPTSFWYPLKTWLETKHVNTPTADETLEQIQKHFKEAILLAINTPTAPAVQTEVAAEVRNLNDLLNTAPEQEPFALHLFSQLKKAVIAPPENVNFTTIRPLIFAAEAEVFRDSPLPLQRHILDYLWDLQNTFLATNALPLREQLEEYSALKQLLPNVITKDAEEKRTLLQLKIEELELLDYLSSKIFAERLIEKNETKVITEILSLLTEKKDVQELLFDPTKFPAGQNPADLFLVQINAIPTLPAQETKIKELLPALPETRENLSLLQEIRSRLEGGARALITAQMIRILESEERNIAV